MPEFRYGPVELYLVGFEGERPEPSTLDAIRELVDAGLVRLLDVLLISKDAAGDVEIVEMAENPSAFGLEGFDLAAVGIAGEEDVAELADLVPAGGSAALVAMELTYARRLAEQLASSGAKVLSSERIPAPVVNALADLAEQD